jgi:hypothetical protein
MYRIWYLFGAVVLWLVLYQGFFRYAYTMKDGYAVKRYDRLTGTTCGIPECLPATPTPVPKPTVFDPVVSYGEVKARMQHEARQAVDMVKKTEFGQELMHSPDAKKFVWTVELADSTAGGVFVLHDPKDKNAIPVTPSYIESLKNPAYKVKLVCFCDKTGSGFRWEVNLNKKTLAYVNDNPVLEKKYGLTDARTKKT